MVDAAVRKFKGDTKRLYLLGESLGGDGVLELASSAPGKFAACASICGSVEDYDWDDWVWADQPEAFNNLANRLASELPLAIVHGTEDEYVPLDQARNLRSAVLD